MDMRRWLRQSPVCCALGLLFQSNAARDRAGRTADLAHPGVKQVRFVNTGTEAVMFAIKAARAFTGKPAIARFAGAYHGAYDWARSAKAQTSQTIKPMRCQKTAYEGAPRSTSADVVLLDFNDGVGSNSSCRRMSIAGCNPDRSGFQAAPACWRPIRSSSND